MVLSRKWLLPVLIFFAVFVFSSQGLKGGPEVSVKDMNTLMKGEPRPVIIDVRNTAEYQLGHITGALSVPHADFKARLDSLKLPKVDAVVLYGAGDTEARALTKHLYENGYQGALTLKGGIDAWLAAGQAVAKKQ